MAPYYSGGTLHAGCTVRVNGVVWMEGNAWNMHHTFGAMLERASQYSRIVPGDVIASGTVGSGSISEAVRKAYPARSLQRGDVVELEVERIGTLRNDLYPKPKAAVYRADRTADAATAMRRGPAPRPRADSPARSQPDLRR